MAELTSLMAESRALMARIISSLSYLRLISSSPFLLQNRPLAASCRFNGSAGKLFELREVFFQSVETFIAIAVSDYISDAFSVEDKL